MDINEKIIKLLVAAGHVTEEKVEQARHLAETLKWEDENASQQPLAPDAACGHASSDNWKIDESGNMYCVLCRAGKA